MEIRRATAADAVGILDCLRIAFEPYRTSYTPAGFEDTVLNARSLADRFQTMTLFVAVGDDQVVGTIAAAAHGTEGHLRGMAVLPEWQGSDIARRLIEAAEAELMARGCVRVTLDTTEPLKRAARFYEKCGYRRTGRSTDFFGMALTEFAKTLTNRTS
jgi:ribosomal protein S18 acetylase RimI-like enzyme